MFATEIEQRTPAGIAAGVGRLISSGRLGVGDRLPTVRELASELGVSPATVSQAWQALGSVGLIVSRGRNGTFVREPASPRSPRSQSAPSPAFDAHLDLSRGAPDPALLPALGPPLFRASQRADASISADMSVIPELLELLERSWPYRAESFTIVNGALDALSRSLEQICSFGDHVIVENPAFPPFFDLLEQLGLTPVAVEVDQNGIVPAALEVALAASPTAIILQPRAHNPTGASMSAERAEHLARLLRPSGAIIIEDDHSGDVSSAPDVSLGTWLPNRVVHIRSFSKSHGPDLRIAALGGPAAIIDRVVARRLLGPGWTSRTMQSLLHDLLTDAASIAEVAEGRRSYAARQKSLANALSLLGMNLPPADGLNVWIPVHNEQSAIIELAAGGIRVASGSPFHPFEVEQPHIRVSVSALPERIEPVARALASAASPALAKAHGLHARWA